MGGQEKDYYAARLIDATPDADLAAAAGGVPYTVGAEDYGGEPEKQWE